MSNVRSEERPAAAGHAGEPTAGERPEAGAAVTAAQETDADASVSGEPESGSAPAGEETATDTEESGEGHPKPANWSTP